MYRYRPSLAGLVTIPVCYVVLVPVGRLQPTGEVLQFYIMIKIFLLYSTLMISLGNCLKPQPSFTKYEFFTTAPYNSFFVIRPQCYSPPCHVRNISAKVYLTDELHERVEKFLRTRDGSKGKYYTLT